MRAGRQARLHDREILIGEREVHDMRRADRADQRRGRVDMIGVDLGGLDRDARAFLHRLGDRVAFELAAAGQRDVGKDVGVHRHLVHRDRTDAARADHQYLAHEKSPARYAAACVVCRAL